jgi:ATP-dependent 26S proteasome regulatory subunit
MDPAVWDTLLFVLGDGLVTLQRRGLEAEISMYAGSPELLIQMESTLQCCLDRDSTAWVLLLSADKRGGVSVTRVAQIEEPLIRENYAPEILEGFDHVLGDLASPSPCGRLVLLEGPPGTGKTHLVRGLIACSKASFVIVPSALAGMLGNPELVSALIDDRARRRGDGPVVMVLEDADSALVPRRSDNADQVSALLNASEGIIGVALDLRILATTNARLNEVDAAFLRPGRLCHRIEMGLLAPPHASRVFERLTGSSRTFAEPSTLAEVYAVSRGRPAREAGRHSRPGF